MIGLVPRMQQPSRPMLLGTRKGSSGGVRGGGAGGVGGGGAGGAIGRSSPTGVGWGTGGGGMGVWSVRVRHVLWLLLLWMVCGVHLLYLFASNGVQEQSEPLQSEGKGEIISVFRRGVDSYQGELLVRKASQSSGGLDIVQHLNVDSWFKGRTVKEDQGPKEEGPGRSSSPDRPLDTEEEGALEDTALSGAQIGGPPTGVQQMRKLAVIDSYAKRIAKIGPSWDMQSASKYDSQLHLPTSKKDRQTAASVGGHVGGHKRGEVKEGGRGGQSSLHTVKDLKAVVTGNKSNRFNPPGTRERQHLNHRSNTVKTYAWIACSSVSPPIPQGSLEKPVWQAVRSGQSYVFSAFYDPRELVAGRKAQYRVIRVIGITDTRVDGAPHFCQLWYRRIGPAAQGHQGESNERRTERIHYSGAGVHHPNRQRAVNDTQGSRQGGLDLVVVPAISDIVPETHGLRFAPFIYTCRLTSEIVPVGVSLTHTRCEPPLNFLPIHPANPASHDQRSYNATNYTVCVTPLNMMYNNSRQLVEKIETDRMFGANNFVFYNLSSGPALGKYLESYQREGIVRVIPWNIPVKVDTWPPNSREVDIHYFGQLAALNDCLYRNMFTSRMIVFTDMDEIIVPKKYRTWREMVKFLIYKGQGSAGTFVFQNAFFRTEWPDDKLFVKERTSGSPPFSSLSPPSPTDLPTIDVISLLKTKREKYIYPWGLRSKYICDPLKVEMVGVHNVWRFVNDSFTELDVPSDIGLLHHYRSWNRPEETNSVIDRSMHRYKDSISTKIRQRHLSVRNYSSSGYALL